METVVIYPGRFHPFHKGHRSVYDTLVKRFGKNRVFIATSNKVDPPKSPFTFDEKRKIMALTGVDPSRVVMVKNPYQPTEILDNYDPKNTIALFAVSEKDMAEDPRFAFKPKKDGSPSYYQPAQKEMKGFDEHGYIVTVPTLEFTVLGEPMRSATEFRSNFAKADYKKQAEMMTDLFGAYDKGIHDLMQGKISERLIRADEILEQLIDMGADDKYIVEACARVEGLIEDMARQHSRKSLYQAIMEGGHNLPESEMACPVATGDLKINTENRDRTIKQFNYGPLNVDEPADYWTKIADYWDTTEEAAKKSKCANCVAFDISPRMKECMPGDTFDEDGELGYCWMHHFKCHSERSCHTWAKGGPIEKNSESEEWQGKAFGGVKEEITDYDDADPMNSIIAVRGIGTMSISSVLEVFSKVGQAIKYLADNKDHPEIQSKMPMYLDRLVNYMNSLNAAYKELAQQRKRGGTKSKGIDKDIQENDYQTYQRLKGFQNQAAVNKQTSNYAGSLGNSSKVLARDVANLDKQNPNFANKYAKDIAARKKRAPQDLDRLTKSMNKFDEHCGDPMAPDHAKDRALLYKLYRKGLNAVPGSQQHKEILSMIAELRKKIGLDEAWSAKYKRSIDCDNPKGFSQKAHCAGRKK